MATPKIKIDPEQVKKLVKSVTKNTFVMDPHGMTPRSIPGRQNHKYLSENPLGVSSTSINHCQLGGSGDMSGCYACHYSDDKSKIQCQRACNFFIKSSSHERCMWETYGEFCWSTKAQDDKKSKGF